jgi:hypothetical protein
MSHLVPNLFSTYAMNEEEALQSSILTIDQSENIQNQIAILAEKKLLLQPDTDNYSKYIQTEAYYRGQIDALKFLLESSISANEMLNNPTQEPN